MQQVTGETEQELTGKKADSSKGRWEGAGRKAHAGRAVRDCEEDRSSSLEALSNHSCKRNIFKVNCKVKNYLNWIDRQSIFIITINIIF